MFRVHLLILRAQSFHQALNRLSDRRMKVELAFHRAEYVQEELQTHLAELEAEVDLLHEWSKSLTEQSEAESTQPAETAESLERRRQGIVRKAKEYQAQLALLNSATSSSAIRISDLTRLQQENKDREKEIRLKRKKVDAFHGLPADPDLARIALVQATENLKELIRVREDLLHRMIED
ncbi:hypothetical protein GYMLUDRAFT_1027645 [Collybiopsis luxurians FD-317 M1]|nr:hypothetical protein GYMLUDRAFT_1027645 [Collybiopsis luxurians FD-317 M1]